MVDVNNLSESEKELLLENLLKSMDEKPKQEEDSPRKKRKRRRKSKKANEQAKQQPTQQKSSSSLPYQNLQGNSWVSAERVDRGKNEFEENKVKVKNDRLWKRLDSEQAKSSGKGEEIITRGSNTAQKIEARCKKCNKTEFVSPSLAQHDKDLGWVYFCNSCCLGGGSRR